MEDCLESHNQRHVPQKKSISVLEGSGNTLDQIFYRTFARQERNDRQLFHVGHQDLHQDFCLFRFESFHDGHPNHILPE